MEEINKLLNIENLKIVQNSDWFKFSLDSVLLANFVNIENKNLKVIDFCTGNAPIPLLLSRKLDSEIIGVEIQKEIFELAKKSININKLNNKIKILNKNVNDLTKEYESDTFDLITCNPPYFKVYKNSLFTKNDIKTIARHEIKITLEDIMKVSKKILKNNGKLAIVHRTERIIDILYLMKTYNIEPKRIQFVYSKQNMDSNIVLVEGAKNGNPGVKILPPLYIHDDNGDYLENIRKMFE